MLCCRNTAYLVPFMISTFIFGTCFTERHTAKAVHIIRLYFVLFIEFHVALAWTKFAEVASTTQNTGRARSKSNTAVLHRQLLQLISLAGSSRLRRRN